MTLSEIIDRCRHELRHVSGIDMYDLKQEVNSVYRWIHGDFLYPITMEEASFTWGSADGSEFDVSSDVSRWRGKVVWLQKGTAYLQQTSAWHIYDLRSRGLTLSHEGEEVFGVYGTKLVLVAAPSSDTTFTVKHYALPADLTGWDDVPILDPDKHDVIVFGVVANILEDLRNQETTRWGRMNRGATEAQAVQDFTRLVKDMKADARRDTTVNLRNEPSEQAKGFYNLQSSRRRIRG